MEALLHWLSTIKHMMTIRFVGIACRIRDQGAAVFLWLTLICGLTGCLVHRRQKIPVSSSHPEPVWRAATLQDLLDRIKKQQDAIETLDLTATIEPSASS